MRISDWSSDVCSSDLAFHREAQRGVRVLRLTRLVHALVGAHRGTAGITMRLTRDLHEIGRASRRARSVSVRVDLGGRRIIKKKKRRLSGTNLQHITIDLMTVKTQNTKTN